MDGHPKHCLRTQKSLTFRHYQTMRFAQRLPQHMFCYYLSLAYAKYTVHTWVVFYEWGGWQRFGFRTHDDQPHPVHPMSHSSVYCGPHLASSFSPTAHINPRGTRDGGTATIVSKRTRANSGQQFFGHPVGHGENKYLCKAQRFSSSRRGQHQGGHRHRVKSRR